MRWRRRRLGVESALLGAAGQPLQLQPRPLLLVGVDVRQQVTRLAEAGDVRRNTEEVSVVLGVTQYSSSLLVKLRSLLVTGAATQQIVSRVT